MKSQFVLLTAAVLIQVGCSSPPPAEKKQPVAAVRAPEPVKILQFYATVPALTRGEKTLLCYGVENSKTVILEPPRQELSNAYSRCVEAAPTETTTYTLTATGAVGAPATKQVTVSVKGAKVGAKITNVQFTSLDVKKGDLVGICYEAQHALSVKIEPIHFNGPADKGCAHVQPTETTTYVVTATGANGEQDEVKGTVKVK